MAEKGTTIIAQSGGHNTAVRDAVELDDNSNARLIQHADFSRTPIISPAGSPIRANVTVADPGLLSSMPAEIINNLITCGDKSQLVVWAEFTGVATVSDTVRLTLLWYDNEATPGYIACEGGVSIYFNAYASTYLNDGITTRSNTYTWDLRGAPRVGIHIPLLSLNTCTDVSVYAFVI